VSDGQDGHDGGHRSPRSVEVRVAAKLENLAVLRTVVGAVGTYEDLDFDSVADLRLAVDEACTRLIRSATPDATLVLVIHLRRSSSSSTCRQRARRPTSSCQAASAGTS
jgi:serine/threonine-protein kinase RsbW